MKDELIILEAFLKNSPDYAVTAVPIFNKKWNKNFIYNNGKLVEKLSINGEVTVEKIGNNVIFTIVNKKYPYRSVVLEALQSGHLKLNGSIIYGKFAEKMFEKLN